MSEAQRPPVIELPAAGASIEAERHAAAAVLAAATDTGFFYLRGHEATPMLVEQARAASREFFALPAETKATAAIDRQQRGWMALGGATMYGAAEADLKEVFFFGPDFHADDPEVCECRPLCAVNRWPAAMPGLRSGVWPCYEALMRSGCRLLRLVALALDLPADFFEPHYQRPLGRAQIIRYPPQPEDTTHERYGVAPHTDFGCVTLLLQDECGGLEVCRRDGSWMPVPPLEDTLVVNLGDLLARWSNDRFASTPHRVVNRAPRHRYSIALFCDPASDAVVDPLAMRLPPGVAPRYEPVTAGEYIASRNRGAFAHYAVPGTQ